MDLLIFILICYGLTNIIVNEVIFMKLIDKLKRFTFIYNLLTCPVCLGFWLGMLFFIILQPFSYTFIVFDMIMGGFLISGVNNIIELIKNRINYGE
jgi:hypothetical protein